MRPDRPNGAGKTTLLRALMGALPASGSVTLNDVDLLALPDHRRVVHGIGYMPEDRRLVPEFTVEENIRLPAWTTQDDGVDERLKWISRSCRRSRISATAARWNCPAASRRWWRLRAR